MNKKVSNTLRDILKYTLIGLNVGAIAVAVYLVLHFNGLLTIGQLDSGVNQVINWNDLEQVSPYPKDTEMGLYFLEVVWSRSNSGFPGEVLVTTNQRLEGPRDRDLLTPEYIDTTFARPTNLDHFTPKFLTNIKGLDLD